MGLHNMSTDVAGTTSSLGSLHAEFRPTASDLSALSFGSSRVSRASPMGHPFLDSHSTLKFSTLAPWERLLLEAGVNKADAVFVFKPGSEQASLRTTDDVFQQGMHLDRQGLTYSVQGEPIGDLTNWIMGNRGEFSALTLWTNGREYALAPSYTLNEIAPGTSMSVSSNVGRFMSMTDGLTPQFNHMLSGDIQDPSSGADVANGRLVINSYRIFSLSDATVTRFDFRGEQLDASLLLGTGLQGYNFIALRGIGHPYQSVLQGDAFYLQNSEGSSGIAGSLSVFRELGPQRDLYRISLEGYHLFRGGQEEANPFYGSGLGGPQADPQSGLRFYLELRR